jgi:4-aminobutyrate aminotransferase/(S)-3-amino-2-methylpropionate transaminase
MLAIELVNGAGDITPNAALTAAVNKACHAAGLVTLTCGTYGNVFRFLPPLAAGDDVLTEGLDILEEAFTSAAG